MESFPTGLFKGPYFGKVSSSAYYTPENTAIKRWKYEVEIVEFGADDWNDHVVPSVVSDVLNVFESANTSTVSMGIAHSALPGTYELQPVPNSTVVPIWLSPIGAFLMWPNQFDGVCA